MKSRKEDKTLTLDEILEGGVIVAIDGDVVLRYNREAKKNGAFSAFLITMEGIVPVPGLLMSPPQLEQRFSADVACLQEAAREIARNISYILEEG